MIEKKERDRVVEAVCVCVYVWWFASLAFTAVRERQKSSRGDMEG